VRRKSGPLCAFPQRQLYAVGVAGAALGLARAMLSAFAELAAEKTPRGLARLADTATTEIYTLSLHDALPICAAQADGVPDIMQFGLFDREQQGPQGRFAQMVQA